MFLLVPIGHERMEVRRLPWVTITIAVLCLGVQVWSTSRESVVVHRYVALMQQAERERVGAGDIERIPPQIATDPGAAERARDHNAEDTAQRIEALQSEAQALVRTLPVFRLGYLPTSRNPLRMITYAFAHGGWMHLIGNMLFLWLVGLNLEDRWGRWRFLAFYLVGAVVSALAFRALHTSGTTPLVGASGAIAAVMGAFALCYPSTKIRFFYAYFAFGRPRWGTFFAAAWVSLLLWFAQQVLMMFIEARAGASVAYSAHAGGFAMGAITAAVLRKTGLDKRFDDEAEEEITTFKEDPVFVDATLAFERGDAAAAFRLVDDVLRRTPQHHEARLLALRAAEMLGDAERVAKALAPAFETMVVRREFEALTQRYAEVRNRFQALVPDERTVRAVIGAARRCEAPGALADVTMMALAHHPNCDVVPGALWATAEALTRAGRSADARNALERLVASYPHDPFADRARATLSAATAADAMGA
jgi:membrane associated rhomboid family serine protease